MQQASDLPGRGRIPRGSAPGDQDHSTVIGVRIGNRIDETSGALAEATQDKAVKDLVGLTTVPVPMDRGGQAAYAFFSDATLGADPKFQYALYQSAEADVEYCSP